MVEQSQAATMTINATNSGSYNFNGSTTNPLYTQASTSSYVTGRTTNPQANRGYFVFPIPGDMSKTSRTILGATLTLVNPSGGSGSGLTATGRTLNITNFNNNNITNLLNNGGGTNTGRQTVFNDLGALTGTIYGTTLVTSNTTTPVTVNLNAANILTDIRSRAGQQLAMGAALTGLNTSINQHIFFNSTNTPASNRQLTISYADAILESNGDQQFGNVLIGQSSDKSFTVTNNGESGSTLTGSIGASMTGAIQPTTGTVDFSLGSGQSASRTFTFTPTVRGTNQTNIPIISNDVNRNPLLTGIGVAPQNAITGSTTDGGFVRIGTSATLGVTVQNVGDGNLSGQPGSLSNLNGTASLTGSSDNFLLTAGSVGNFSLTDNVSKDFNVLYTPITSGAETQQLTLSFTNGKDDGTNQGQTKIVNLSAHGVGPAFQSGPPENSTLDFGIIPRRSTALLPLVISNGSQDPTQDVSLTGLTLLDAFFEGSDRSLFSLLNFTPGTVLGRGDSLSLEIVFNALTTGQKNATLHILTDQGAAFGHGGQLFSYNLTAIGVPEPSSLLGIGVFGATGMLLKCRRKS